MDENKTVTAFDVIRGIYALAEACPGVYNRHDGNNTGCVNTEIVDGEVVGSCLVGSFLLEHAKVPAEDIEPSGGYRTTIASLEELGWAFEPKAKALLGAAQAMQDGREITWSAIAGSLLSLSGIMDEFYADESVEMQMTFEPK